MDSLAIYSDMTVFPFRGRLIDGWNAKSCAACTDRFTTTKDAAKFQSAQTNVGREAGYHRSRDHHVVSSARAARSLVSVTVSAATVTVGSPGLAEQASSTAGLT